MGGQRSNVRRAARWRRIARVGPLGVALVFASARSVALAAGTFALPPSMFPLDGPVPPEIEAARELTLFRRVRLSDPPVLDDGIELRLHEPAACHRLDLSGSIPPRLTTPYLHPARP